MAGGRGASPRPWWVGLAPGQAGHDLARQRQGVLVVERLVVGDAGDPGVDGGPAELLRCDDLAGRRLDQRWAAQEDGAGAADDDGLVAHRRHVGAAGGARAHDEGDLRDAGRAHARLVVEDAAEVVAVGEDLVLERQEGAAGVDQVEAGEAVLERDLLRAKVLLDRHRVVGAALDRGVVGDDDALGAADHADAGHDAGARRVAVVQPVRGQGAQLEERRARVEQPVDALADGQLARVPDGGRWSDHRRRRRVRSGRPSWRAAHGPAPAWRRRWSARSPSSGRRGSAAVPSPPMIGGPERLHGRVLVRTQKALA